MGGGGELTCDVSTASDRRLAIAALQTQGSRCDAEGWSRMQTRHAVQNCVTLRPGHSALSHCQLSRPEHP